MGLLNRLKDSWLESEAREERRARSKVHIESSLTFAAMWIDDVFASRENDFASRVAAAEALRNIVEAYERFYDD